MDYYQGYEDAMRQARVTRPFGLIGLLASFFISLLYSAFIYVPLLIISFVIMQILSPLFSNDIFIKIGLTGAIAYVLFAFIYLLKGLLIGLRSSKKRMWILMWLTCVLLTCGVQAIFTVMGLTDFFLSRNVANAHVWSFLFGGAVSIVIYSHYQFLTNVAPRSVFWAYQIGFNRTKIQKVEKSKPEKSASFFYNAPMKVSFRKLPGSTFKGLP